MAKPTTVANVRTSAPYSEATAAATPAKRADGNIEVTDSRGRIIVVKKLSALDKMRLTRIVGADGSMNQAYMGYAVTAASVVSIDGDPEPFPKSIQAIEAIVAQLDDDGLNVVSNAIGELNDVGTFAEDLAIAKN